MRPQTPIPDQIDPTRPNRVGARHARAAAKRRTALRVLSVLGLAVVIGAAVWAGVAPRHSVPALAAGAASCAPSRAVVPVSAGVDAKAASASAPGTAADVSRAASPSAVKALYVAPKSSSVKPVVAAEVKPTATRVVATAESVAAVQATVATGAPSSEGTITIETFGYSFAKAPGGCRFIADVRNIRAGTFKPTQTGLQASVRKRVMATAGAKKWHMIMKTRWLPQLKDGDKVAIGCSRGHHRSVSLAVVFGRDLKAAGFKVKYINRDIHKHW